MIAACAFLLGLWVGVRLTGLRGAANHGHALFLRPPHEEEFYNFYESWEST